MTGTVDLRSALLQLDTCVWKIEQGMPISAQHYEALSRLVDTLAPAVDDTGRVQLAQRVDRVIGALEVGRARLAEQLRTAGAGRRAVGAYAARSGGPR